MYPYLLLLSFLRVLIEGRRPSKVDGHLNKERMGLGRQWADRLYKKNLKTHSHRSQSVLGQHDARYQVNSVEFIHYPSRPIIFVLLSNTFIFAKIFFFYQCQSFPFRRRLANDELFCLLNPLLCKSSGVLTRQVMVSPHE